MKNKKSIAELLTKRINDKYRNLSRFAVLSGESYWKLYSFIHSQDKAKESYIKALMAATDDKLLKSEISPLLICDIIEKLPDDQDGVMSFCRNNGVQHYWLEGLLNGKVVFINNRVKRLLSILKIKP